MSRKNIKLTENALLCRFGYLLLNVYKNNGMLDLAQMVSLVKRR